MTFCRAVAARRVLSSTWKGASGSSNAASIVKEYHAALKSFSFGSWRPNGAVGSVSASFRRVWSSCAARGGARCVVAVASWSFVKNGKVSSSSGPRVAR
eukprot:5026900-Pyramimonas_sp.AAC.1